MKASLLFAALWALTSAHEVPTKPQGVTWQAWHMKEEHQLDSFDPEAFFKLHDLLAKGYWDKKDILYVYGLSREEVVGDGSGMGEHAHEEQISAEAKDTVTLVMMRLLDTDKNGQISQEEFVKFMEAGELPDFGYGPGHHLDFENEYETHHWNQYHRDQDPEVHVKHKEDIEHELLHHAHEIEESHGKLPDVRELAKNFLSPVKIANVPQKYLA